MSPSLAMCNVQASLTYRASRTTVTQEFEPKPDAEKDDDDFVQDLIAMYVDVWHVSTLLTMLV